MYQIIGFLLIAGSALQPQVAYAETIPGPLPVVEATTSPEGVESFIRGVQAQYGLGDDFTATAACEGQFNPLAEGDNHTSFGTWQIHLPAHPEISKKQAEDINWSTEWAAQQFLKGSADIWTCHRQLKKSATEVAD